MSHCATCTCETPVERADRLEREKRQRAQEERDRQLAKRHSILTDEDLAWSRERLANR